MNVYELFNRFIYKMLICQFINLSLWCFTETSDAPQNERYYNSHDALQEADTLYADFGASTGDNGSFGWHAEFPVNPGY